VFRKSPDVHFKDILHDDEHRISSLLTAAIVPSIAVLQQNSFTAFFSETVKWHFVMRANFVTAIGQY